MARWWTCSFVLALVLAGCGKGTESGATRELVVFHAGSLAIPLREIAAAFEASHPGVKVVREASGSRAAARKLSDLGRTCDVLALADYTVIDELLLGQHATWNLIFAANEMVLAYPADLPADGIPNLDSWPQLLMVAGTRVGHSDPDSDPCGYRALMVLQLAERSLAVAGLQAAVEANAEGHIRPKASDLVALLEVGELDFAFLYRSVALQHGIPFLELPAAVNLGDSGRAAEYGAVSVEVTGPAPGTTIAKRGGPIAYGVTIPHGAPQPQLALEFVEFLVSAEQGMAVLQKYGQSSLIPSPTLTYNQLPERLRAYASDQN